MTKQKLKGKWMFSVTKKRFEEVEKCSKAEREGTRINAHLQSQHWGRSQVGQDFKVILGYTVNLRPFWARKSCLKQTHTRITTTKMKPPELKDLLMGE